ncbi:protein tramtrack, beta isoform isoform X3 [Diabrotica virgifera virgifera]|uniref:Protein tramtrack, beta isoform-like isoform X2 n=1 Tax=Diabrotica virgifera virgifera TaxID=50390 RepID=A0A6P7H3K4_DIAVI|nr:protein tramtrack, beta isoform isoform X3 [Diabrotica virgifera virgifera]
MSSEQFSLCWDNFHKNMSSGMNSLLENEDLVDVTLAVQGKCLKAHKMVLSVCSPYFKELFKSNPCKHPIVFMKDVSYEALSDLLQFMYQGEVQVSQENLTTFIKTAEALQIKGLTGDGNGSTDSDVVEVPAEKRTPHVEDYKPVSVPRPKKQQPPPAPMSSPSVKRQRLSASTSDTQPLPPPVTKVEPIAPPQPVPISTPESSPLHFKTEPYEQSVSLLDETGDDTFNEDTLDETVGDDNEDYSMMESGSGEEPQAGTSTDGAGEGQESDSYSEYDDSKGYNKYSPIEDSNSDSNYDLQNVTYVDLNVLLKKKAKKPLIYSDLDQSQVRKQKRNAGEEYVGYKNKLVEAKSVKSYIHTCRYQCQKFTDEQRQEIFNQFWGLGNWNLQNAFITSCTEITLPKRRSTGAVTNKGKSVTIKLKNMRVCKMFFLKTLDISNGRYSRILNRIDI